MVKNILFVFAVLIIVAATALFLFGTSRAASNPSANSPSQSSSSGGTGSDFYLTDGVFTPEDVFETSPLGDHSSLLSADKYATYCRDLQQSGRFSQSVHVNAVLAVKAYIAPEELPVYEMLLGNIPADAENTVAFSMTTVNSQAMWDKYLDKGLKRVIVTPEMVENIFMVPFDLHQQIVSLCH